MKKAILPILNSVMKNKDTNLDKVQSVEFSTEEKIQTAIDFAPRFFLVCAVSYVVQYVKLTLLTMKLALVIIPLFLLVGWMFGFTL